MTNQKADGLIEGLRVRHDGWTPVRQRTFLRALAEIGCVRDACARAGISNVSAYRMKKRSERFARAWDRALAKAAPTIEQAAYERAVLGWEEPIVQGGKVVGTKRRYSDSLLRLLVQRGMVSTDAAAAARPMSERDLVTEAKRAAQAAGGFFVTKASSEETDRALERKLDALARAQARRDAEAAGPAATAEAGAPIDAG